MFFRSIAAERRFRGMISNTFFPHPLPLPPSPPTPLFPLHFDLVGFGERVSHQPHCPKSASTRTKEPLAFSSRLVSTTFLPIPRLALVHSTITCLTPSPHNRPPVPHCNVVSARTYSCTVSGTSAMRTAFIEISLPHVLIESSPP